MKRVILHIGTTKTGSTALQYSIKANIDLLKDKGVLYYQPAHRYVSWEKASNGDVILYHVYEKLGKKLDSSVLANLKEDREEIRRNLSFYNTFIFSEETIWESSTCNEGFWDALRECILSIFGSDVVITIVVYLRRQDEWAFSKWRQDARSINSIRIMQFEEYAFNSSACLIMDYSKGLKSIEKVFGISNVIVRKYDRCDFADGNIYYDFLDTCNIVEYEDHFILPDSLNQSITLEAAEAAILIRQGKFNISYDPKKLSSSTVLFSRFYPMKKPSYPLSYEDRKRLIDIYHDGNEYVSAVFFDGHPIFQDDFDDYEPLAYDSVRAEKNASTLLKLASLSDKRQTQLLRGLPKPHQPLTKPHD